MKPKILLVDDEASMLRSLELLLLSEDNYTIYKAKNAEQAMQFIESGVDLVVTDLTMPGKDGLSLLKEIKEFDREIEVVIMTAYSTVKSAISAMKEGAFDYLIKPFDHDEFLQVVKNSLKLSKLRTENRKLTTALSNKYNKKLIGNSAKIRAIYNLVKRASDVNSTVLITGESGTGKEIVARAIHYGGIKKNDPFVTINCATLPETLLESELFGYAKGAFTGAYSTKEGKFEQAHKGTIFLDEIAEMTPHLQSKLLRVLQEKTIEKLGSNEQIKIDVRVIAATNRNLIKLINEQSFREDLFFRLNVININIPALKERKSDIPILVDHFLKNKCQELGENIKILDQTTLDKLMNYDFPGNVRELENIIERACIIARGNIIKPSDIPIDSIFITKKSDMDIPVEDGFEIIQKKTKDMEINIIKKAISENTNITNQELAAKLGTTRRVLELRLREYGIKR